MHVDDIGTHGEGALPRERPPSRGGRPEGMEGTMSSSVSLFKTAAVVVDPKKRQSPPKGALPGGP